MITEERSRQYHEYCSLPMLTWLLLATLGWIARGAVFARLP